MPEAHQIGLIHDRLVPGPLRQFLVSDTVVLAAPLDAAVSAVPMWWVCDTPRLFTPGQPGYDDLRQIAESAQQAVHWVRD